MNVFRTLIVLLSLPFYSMGQGGGVTGSLGDLPNYIPPTPEVASILKANFLSANPSTGAANFSIPIHNLSIGGFTLPVSLNYNSTGIRVDEIASMVGIGWNLNYGGVVSRVVMETPDEVRDQSSNNWTSHNFTTPDYALLDYFDKDNADKQSDIFSFSFGGHNGKFVLDQNHIPKPLSQYNLKISVINGTFLDGFKIIADNGTEYYFEAVETSIDRNLLGFNCKTAINEYFDEVKTSWFLSKIKLPSRQSEINFTYTEGTTQFRNGINESLALKIATEYYLCGADAVVGPTGPVCNVWETRFSSCSRNQMVQSKFISKIETSDGDKIEFFYDPTGREDLIGGLRLAYLKVQNYQGRVIKYAYLNSTYKIAINSTSDFESKRLFLESMQIRDGNNSVENQLVYSFSYNNNTALPKRLSYAQDIYGFYNGKISNTCLIPKLEPSDLNYTRFNNGTGYGSVNFGDRSVDADFCKYGLLTSIGYPTGGEEVIIYTPNYTLVNETGTEVEKLCGGVSVQKIISYSSPNIIATEKEFVYRNYTDNKLSTFLVTGNPKFSEVRTVKSDGYVCQTFTWSPETIICVGPSCTNATSYSSSLYPITTSGSQHVYHRTVLEYTKNGIVNNGLIEHKYKYYMDGGLVPVTKMGEQIYSIPYNVVPEILIGEEQTNIYKKNGTTYQMLKSTINEFENTTESIINNHFVRKNYQSFCGNRPGPVTIGELEAYDVMEGRIYFNTPVLKSVKERIWGDNGSFLETMTTMDYNPTLYSYPIRIKTTNSKGIESKVERLYPPDFPALSFMTGRNIISPVIEEKTFKNNVLQFVKNTTFVDWFSNTNLIVPQSSELKNGNNLLLQKFLFKSYDNKGNVLQLSKENDVDVFYLYGYKSSYPVAQVTGISASQLQAVGINQSILDNPTTDAALRTELGKLRTNLPACIPSTIYTYVPMIGQTSSTDLNGRTSYYEYDAFNRLTLIRDKDNNIIKKVCYNYTGQVEECGVPVVNTNPNWQNTTTALRCQLTGGQNTGYQEQEQKDMNPSSPTYNQLRWVQAAYNIIACPFPVTITYNNIVAVSGYVALYQNVSTSQNYTFYIPASGSGTLGTLPAGNYNLTIMRGAGMPGFSSFGSGCQYVTDTEGIFYNINISNCHHVTIDYGF